MTARDERLGSEAPSDIVQVVISAVVGDRMHKQHGFDDRGDQFIERAAHLMERVVSGPGELDVAVRQAAATGSPLEGPAGVYAQKVRQHAYRVLDEDVAALHAAGYSDAQIFELTEAAAHGAARVRLDAALAAIAEGGD